MFESNSKFPKFFVYIMAAIAVFVLVGMFFSAKIVAAVYFVGLLLSVVLLILDKKYGTVIANYKLVFFMFDLINLIAVISILYYEHKNHSWILRLFLIALIAIEVILMAVDIFVVKNKKLTRQSNLFVDTFKIGSMICILTYFFNVSELFFAIDAFLVECANLFLKLYINYSSSDSVVKTEKKEKKIEDIIQSVNEEGEIE